MAHHITKIQTVAWLRRKKNDQIIGIAYNPFDCPFRRMLKEVYGIDAGVTINGYKYSSKRYSKHTVSKNLPNWAKKTIQIVDSKAVTEDGAIEQDVTLTVGEFKDALRQVGIKV